MYNLIEYSDNYSETSGSLGQCENDRTSYSNYCLPKIEIKDYNIMIDSKNFFDQPINSKLKTWKY